MKLRTCLLPLVAAVALVTQASAQGAPSMAAPDEMKALAYLTGTWTGKMKMYGMGPEPMEAESQMVCESILGGRFMRGMVTYDMGGMKMSGMQLQTYDADAKKWKVWWFDSMSAQPVEMTGDMKGDTCVLESKPMKMTGMEGESVFRATYTKVSDTEFTMKLEMKDGDKWSPMIEETMKKKA
ncbi:MAG: DUF1579 family protein [Armatimonadetes bacterium]|nr:DUF1579 family protein [Armatimonadota bacterium]